MSVDVTYKVPTQKIEVRPPVGDVRSFPSVDAAKAFIEGDGVPVGTSYIITTTAQEAVKRALWTPRWAEIVPPEYQLAGLEPESRSTDWYLDTQNRPMPGSAYKALNAPMQRLVPTHVWGLDAEQQAARWGARWSTGSFAEFRKTFHKDRPLVLYIPSGIYDGQDWYLGDRPNQEVYIIGDGDTELRNDALSLAKHATWYLKGLVLTNCGIQSQSYRTGDSTKLYVTQCYLRNTQGDQNAVGTPSDDDAGDRWEYHFWDNDLEQLGSRGNTCHALYLHGRPNGYASFCNNRVYGSKGCSVFKSTCVTNRIRHNYISAVQDEDDLSVGLKSAILLDICADSDTSVFNNRLVGYRGAVDAEAGEVGLDAGFIFWRARREILASDRPEYGSAEWSDPKFWTERATVFIKPVCYNSFELVAGSPRKTNGVRDDGTFPRRATKQFAATSVPLPVPQEWWERSRTLSVGNEYINMSDVPKLDGSEVMVKPYPVGWPRTAADEFPTFIVMGIVPDNVML